MSYLLWMDEKKYVVDCAWIWALGRDYVTGITIK